MPKNKLVSVIIPTYNREKEVLICLESLQKIDYKNCEIIVVDNASTDKTVEKIEKNYPQVKLIRLLQNMGAVGGRNKGLKKAKGEYFCFLDSDNVVDKHFLTALVELAESNKKIGIVGPKMYYLKEPKRVWFVGARINLITSRTFFPGRDAVDVGQFEQVKNTFHVPNCWLVKKEVVEKIGPMDEIYFMSYGESDWAERARKAGFKVLFCPQAMVYHDIEKGADIKEHVLVRGSPQRTYFFARNRIIFMKKFASRLNFLLFLLIFNNLFLLLHFFIFFKQRQYASFKSYLQGYLDGLKLLSKVKRVSLHGSTPY